MKRTSILSFLSIVITTASAWSQANSTVSWSNFSLDSTTQNSILFRNAAGTALSQGVATTNTDGMLVQLGYYSAATAANNFAGTWIPITAFGPTLHTSIGDSANLTGSGNGVIDFNTIFGGVNLNTTNVQVYNPPGDTGAYITQSSVTITTSQPPNNQIMSIRFYDTTTGTSGNYNAVSTDDWLWQVPTTSGGGAVVNFLIADNFNGIGAPLEFEASGPLANFRTVIAIPEPSTFALLGVGALSFVGMLRRRAKR